MTERFTQIQQAADYINSIIKSQPEFGLILGSGLGDLAEQIENPIYVQYNDIPHFPQSTVAGHVGRFVAGTLEGRQVLAMQGRFHFYEGYSIQQVTLPVYVMKQLGIDKLFVTNAAGGMNDSFQAGDLMFIQDHINFTGANPLIGPNLGQFGPRFPDMSQAYDRSWIELGLLIAKNEGVLVQKGVYAGISGPTYMTPKELTMLANLGGDAVGMSTVPEVIVARHAGMRVLGISCITDMAIGDSLEPLTHEQVVEVANRTKPKFIMLVKRLIAEVK